jgi:hypothetical protein
MSSAPRRRAYVIGVMRITDFILAAWFRGETHCRTKRVVVIGGGNKKAGLTRLFQ